MNYRHRLQANIARRLSSKAVMLCLLLSFTPLTAQAGSGFGSMMSSMFGAMGSMANMMSTMMSPMNMMGMNYGSSYPMMSSMGMPGMGMGLPGMGIPNMGMPGIGPISNGFSNLPSSTLEPHYDSSNGPGNYWLNGLWVSQEQAVLHINNKTFQLRSKKGSLMGFVTSNGELLNLHVPKSGQTMLFMVKLIGNRMQLKGRNGKTIIFQRQG